MTNFNIKLPHKLAKNVFKEKYFAKSLRDAVTLKLHGLSWHKQARSGKDREKGRQC